MKAFLTVLVLVEMLGAAVPVKADWMLNGAPVSTASGDQHNTIIAPDGTGGAIVVWDDLRNGYKIYAQRMNSSGQMLWTFDGVEVCPVSSEQSNAALLPDGNGGVFVAWSDRRNSQTRVYLQRIDANGNLLWTPEGITACNLGGSGGGGAKIVSDGVGGVIVVWSDYRSGNSDIYAQRLSGMGTIQWAPCGIPVCTLPNDQYWIETDTDGAGGVIVGWDDQRNAVTDRDVYAQRVSAAGVPLWLTNGVQVAVELGGQVIPAVAYDGSGGAFLAWSDRRGGIADDVYVQRLDAMGLPKWSVNGVALTNAEDHQTGPQLVLDGAGGMITLWTDYAPTNGTSFFAQRVDGSGTPQWASGGVPVCTAPGWRYWATVASDGAGGIIATWTDYRFQESDIYAQRLNSSGAPLWNTNGIMVSIADHSQREPVVCSDFNGGAIIAWDDYRSGIESDVYAHRIYADGSVATPVDPVQVAPRFTASRNSPNPFADFTRIAFNLPTPSFVSFHVYDVTGRRVFAEYRDEMRAGRQQIEFSGREETGRPLPSGVYFYRLTTNSGSVSARMVIAR